MFNRDNVNLRILIVFNLMLLMILLILYFTNPSVEIHREAVKESLKKEIKDKENPFAEVFGEILGGYIIDKVIFSEDYLFFSLTKMTSLNETEIIGFGILGKVYILDTEKK